jgi:hypothetical protein
MFQEKYLKYKNKYNKLKKIYQEGGEMHGLYQSLGIKNIIKNIILVIQTKTLSDTILQATIDKFEIVIKITILNILDLEDPRFNIKNFFLFKSNPGYDTKSIRDKLIELYHNWRKLLFIINQEYINHNLRIGSKVYDLLEYNKITGGYLNDIMSRYNFKQIYETISLGQLLPTYLDSRDALFDLLEEIEECYNVIYSNDINSTFQLVPTVYKICNVNKLKIKNDDFSMPNDLDKIKTLAKIVYDLFYKNLSDMSSNNKDFREFIYNQYIGLATPYNSSYGGPFGGPYGSPPGGPISGPTGGPNGGPNGGPPGGPNSGPNDDRPRGPPKRLKSKTHNFINNELRTLDAEISELVGVHRVSEDVDERTGPIEHQPDDFKDDFSDLLPLPKQLFSQQSPSQSPSSFYGLPPIPPPQPLQRSQSYFRTPPSSPPISPRMPPPLPPPLKRSTGIP